MLKIKIIDCNYQVFYSHLKSQIGTIFKAGLTASEYQAVYAQKYHQLENKTECENPKVITEEQR